MKNNQQMTSPNESRITEVLKLAGSHPEFVTGKILTKANREIGTAIISDFLIAFDIIQNSDGDDFLVYLPLGLSMPSIQAVCSIVNHSNTCLRVGKVIIKKDELVVTAHQFVEKNSLPTETNLMRLINEVLFGVNLVLVLRDQHLQKLAAQQSSEFLTSARWN